MDTVVFGKMLLAIGKDLRERRAKWQLYDLGRNQTMLSAPCHIMLCARDGYVASHNVCISDDA